MNKDNKSAADKFAKDLNSALSKYHRDILATSVKRGMLHRAKTGYAVTRPPLGYSKTETPGLYKLNENGLAARSALQALVNDETNLVYVVAYLEMFYHVMTGIEHSGTAWLKCIISNPYYVGYIGYNEQIYLGLHEPLITESEHKKLLVVLGKQKEYNSLKSVAKSIQSN